MWRVKNAVAAWLAVLWSIIPWQAAVNSHKINSQKEIKNKEISEVFTERKENADIFQIWVDTINHENFIHKDISEIFAEYGEEQWLLMINQHLLIELNKIRAQNGTKELVLDEQIIDLAQKQAIHLDSLDKVLHENFWERLKKNNIEFNSYWENLWLWHTNIYDIIQQWMTSPWHSSNIKRRSFKKMGLGIKYNESWNIWVLNFVW